MTEHPHRTSTIESPLRRRLTGERFAQLSDRLARSLPGAVRPEMDVEPISEPDYSEEDQPTAWYEVVPRFPIARSGYDCAAVDEHVAALEQELNELDQELVELRARNPAHDEVAAEIQRVGEETSSILLAAHDRARETTRLAQEQADRCLADAAASALAMKEEAAASSQAMREDAARERDVIQRDIERLNGERARLLRDLEAVAANIASIARSAGEQTFTS